MLLLARLMTGVGLGAALPNLIALTSKRPVRDFAVPPSA